MPEKKTCKQCEHYQFYVGPETTKLGNKVVMWCKAMECLFCYYEAMKENIKCQK